MFAKSLFLTVQKVGKPDFSFFLPIHKSDPGNSPLENLPHGRCLQNQKGTAFQNPFKQLTPTRSSLPCSVIVSLDPHKHLCILASVPLLFIVPRVWNFPSQPWSLPLPIHDRLVSMKPSLIFVVIQSLSRVLQSATPWTAARQASLSITNSWNLLKLISIKSVIPSNHLILCHSPLLPPAGGVFGLPTCKVRKMISFLSTSKL